VLIFRGDTGASRLRRTPAAWRALSDRLHSALSSPTTTPPPSPPPPEPPPHRTSGRQVRCSRFRLDQQHVLVAFADNGLRRRCRAPCIRHQHPLPRAPTSLQQPQSVAASTAQLVSLPDTSRTRRYSFTSLRAVSARKKTINWYISVCIVLRAIELWRGLSLIIAAGRPTRIILGIQICVSLAPHLQIRTNYYEI